MQQEKTGELALLEIELYSEFKNQLTLLEQENKIVFDYENPKGNKDARSHVYRMRKINDALESAHKEAKVYALEYGKSVDNKAKEIKAAIDAMIAVHEEPLLAIEEREKQRVSTILARIENLGKYKELIGITISSAVVSDLLLEAEAFAVDSSLEEFKAEAAIAKDAAVSWLKNILENCVRTEKEKAELEKLRQR